MEKKVITEEQFRGVCKQALPHLKELIENLREIGFDGMTSITVAGDGYISLDAYDSGWSLLKLAGENEARIRKEFDRYAGGISVKYCIAVQETLRREIVVEADSLEEAINHVESEYDKENIVLTADDACVEPDIFEVDWYSEKDIEEMEANYDIRNGSGRISEGWRRHIQHRFQRWR